MQRRVAREEERPRTWFRSDRVFLMGNNEWYFRTREGVELGPYESQFEAEVEAGLLKEMLKHQPDDEAKIALIKEFVLDSFALGHNLSPQFREARTPGKMGAELAAV